MTRAVYLKEIRLLARSAAKKLYHFLPNRYRRYLLRILMTIQPRWFLHHPLYKASLNSTDSIHSSTHYGEYAYVPIVKSHFIDEQLGKFTVRPRFSIIVPVFNTPPNLLYTMVESVRNQWYSDWELVLANDGSTEAKTVKALDEMDDPQIKIIHSDVNFGTAGATNAALDRAANDYIVFLGHNDELTVDCLFELAQCIIAENPDFIYSDEDKLTFDGQFYSPHFKPDWSPDTLMSIMYTGHVACVKRAVAITLGGLRGEFNGCQDWDFILRLSEITNRISHIRKVLYHRRISSESCASDINDLSHVVAASKSVREHALKRRGLTGIIESVPEHPAYLRVNYSLVGNPLISIIIPTKDNYVLLMACINSIFDNTSYEVYEIIIVDNGSSDHATLQYLEQLQQDARVKLVHHDKSFNFSQMINVGVAHANGELLLLLNDDTQALHKDWLNRMGGYAQLSHIGAVGAKLLYGDGKTIQHMGVINRMDGPTHAYNRQPKDIPGYFMRNLIEYNWLAVTGACLMVERKKYQQVGGMDEHLPVAYNDVDFCMCLIEKGFYNVTCQAAMLIHHESISRGNDLLDKSKLARLKNELTYLHNKHPAFSKYDPFFNENYHHGRFCFKLNN